MKRRQFMVIVPEAGDRRTYVGPFDKLATAVMWVAANLEGIKGIQYISMYEPSRYARIVRERYAMDHPPQSVIEIESDLRAEAIRRWRERQADNGRGEGTQSRGFKRSVDDFVRIETQEGMVRCKECQSMLSPEPALEAWGYCSSECERDHKEKEG